MPEPTDYPEMVRRARQAGEMPPFYMPPHVRALGDIVAPDLTRYLAEPAPSMHERVRGLGGDIRGPEATLIPGPGDKLPTSGDPRELPAWFDATMLAGNVLGGLGAKGVLAAVPIAAKAGKAAAKTLTLGEILQGARGELTAAERAATLPNAPYPQFAQEYPAIGPPVLKPKTDPKTKQVIPGKFYEAKQLTPEAEAFMKARAKIAADMEEKGYTPYFDPEKRTYVDPSNYPGPNVDTLMQNQPAKPETMIRYLEKIGAPETMQRLKDAYARGLELGPDTQHWYAMGQLESAYIKELGTKAGRAAFLDEYAVPLASTTSGNNPQTNFLISQFLERQRKLGRPTDIRSHETPATVGGRYFASNVADYNAMRGGGGYPYLGADQPKMHNFARSQIGDLSRAVMDEQMAGGMLAGQEQKFIENTRKGAFGILEAPVHELAAERGIAPGNVQDVAWAGFKNEAGGPMIKVINDAIERTHRLTGMARDEIVQRGLIRKEIPIYGLGGVITADMLKQVNPADFATGGVKGE